MSYNKAAFFPLPLLFSLQNILPHYFQNKVSLNKYFLGNSRDNKCGYPVVMTALTLHQEEELNEKIPSILSKRLLKFRSVPATNVRVLGRSFCWKYGDLLLQFLYVFRYLSVLLYFWSFFWGILAYLSLTLISQVTPDLSNYDW